MVKEKEALYLDSSFLITLPTDAEDKKWIFESLQELYGPIVITDVVYFETLKHHRISQRDGKLTLPVIADKLRDDFNVSHDQETDKKVIDEFIDAGVIQLQRTQTGKKLFAQEIQAHDAGEFSIQELRSYASGNSKVASDDKVNAQRASFNGSVLPSHKMAQVLLERKLITPELYLIWAAAVEERHRINDTPINGCDPTSPSPLKDWLAYDRTVQAYGHGLQVEKMHAVHRSSQAMVLADAIRDAIGHVVKGGESVQVAGEFSGVAVRKVSEPPDHAPMGDTIRKAARAILEGQPEVAVPGANGVWVITQPSSGGKSGHSL